MRTKVPKDKRLQTAVSKDLYKILHKAAEIHDGIDTIKESETEELIVDIIPFIERSMAELGYHLRKGK